jgi:hypothetical protein
MTTRSAASVTSPAVVSLPPTDAIPAEVHEAAARLGVSQYLAQVIELTREIYGGFSRVWVSVDPEFADDTHIVFDAPVTCSVEEALDKDLEWGRRLMEIIPHSPRVYLVSAEFRSSSAG